MKGIILSGGSGTRLKDQKCMGINDTFKFQFALMHIVWCNHIMMDLITEFAESFFRISRGRKEQQSWKGA